MEDRLCGTKIPKREGTSPKKWGRGKTVARGKGGGDGGGGGRGVAIVRTAVVGTAVVGTAVVGTAVVGIAAVETTVVGTALLLDGGGLVDLLLSCSEVVESTFFCLYI